MVVCFFDIDGTLIESGGAGERAMLETLAECFDLTELTAHIPSAGRTDAAITSDLLREHAIDMDRLAEFVNEYHQRLPNALEVCSGRVLPGVDSLLRQLVERADTHLGLLTGNFEKAAWAKLDHYELSPHFGFGAYGDHHVDRDDVARDASDLIRDHVGDVPAESVWVIGDTPSDVKCARAIGAKVVAVATGIFSADLLEEHQPDLLLESLDESAAFVEMLG